MYLNPAAFAIPPRGTFGNVLRNYFDGPGTNNWDLMLAKNFKREGFNVQFRTEFFNAFNRLQLATPSSTNSDAGTTRAPNGNLTGGFGFINPVGGQNALPRNGQLVARFQF